MNIRRTICAELGIDHDAIVAIMKKHNTKTPTTNEEKELFNRFNAACKAERKARLYPDGVRKPIDYGPTLQATPHSRYVYKLRLKQYDQITEEERADHRQYNRNRNALLRKHNEQDATDL